MNIDRFDGGLSTALAPHLIQPHESVTFKNCSTVRGELCPIKDKQPTGEIVNDKWYFDEKNQVVSKSTEEAYWAHNIGETYMIETNVTPLSKLNPDGTLTRASIDAPEDALITVASQQGGNLEAGTYVYYYTYYNDNDGRESAPNAPSNDAVIGTPPPPVTSTTDPANTSLSADARALLTIGRYVNQVREGSGDFGNRVEALHCIWDKFTFTEQSNIDLQANATTIYADPALDAHQKFDALVALADSTPEVSDASGSNESIHTRAFNVAFAGGSASSIVDQLNVIVHPTATTPTEDRDLFYYNLLSQTRASLDATPPAENYADNDEQWHLVNAQCELQGEYTSGSGGGTVQDSTPAPPVVAHGSVQVQGILASNDSDVTKIRLYRLGGTVTVPVLVATLDNVNQNYFDTASTESIAENEVLDTISSTPAPKNGRYLTEFSSALFLAVGTKLRFSDIASPDTWPETNYIELPTDITGLGVVPTGLLVFTRTTTHILVGTEPVSFAIHPLSTTIGCVNHYSIAQVSQNLVWLGEKGIYASLGGGITNVSDIKLDQLDITESINAIGVDNQYILTHSTGSLVADYRGGNSVSFRCMDDTGWIGVKRGDMYIAYNDELYKLYESGTKTMHYMSPIYTAGSLSHNKSFKEAEIAFMGDICVKVWSYSYGREREIVFDRKLDIAHIHDSIKFRNTGSMAYGIQFEIMGTGSVQSIKFAPTSANEKLQG